MGSGGSPRPYDVSPDGRFLLIKEGTADNEAGGFTVVENWSEELRALTRRR
jgi:hypothetical protein